MACLADGEVRAAAALQGVPIPAGDAVGGAEGVCSEGDLEGWLDWQWGEVAAGDVVRGDVFWWVGGELAREACQGGVVEVAGLSDDGVGDVLRQLVSCPRPRFDNLPAETY